MIAHISNLLAACLGVHIHSQPPSPKGRHPEWPHGGPSSSEP
jgi:hypothetical protein